MGKNLKTEFKQPEDELFTLGMCRKTTVRPSPLLQQQTPVSSSPSEMADRRHLAAAVMVKQHEADLKLDAVIFMALLPRPLDFIMDLGLDLQSQRNCVRWEDYLNTNPFYALTCFTIKRLYTWL